MIAGAARNAATAFVLTILLAPVMRRVCIRWRLFDVPGPLKIHTQPIPRLGGVAIAIAFGGAVLLVDGWAEFRSWHFFAALALIWITGLVDDLRGLSPLFRLAAQIVAAVILWHGGWRVPITGPHAIGLCATCVLTVFVINAFNFLDGADGVAAGVTVLISLAYGVTIAGAAGHLGGVVAWSLLGACAGFLVFNYPPARFFMGDSGSTVLGFGVAFLGLDSYSSNDSVSSLVFPFVVAGLPLLDAAFAVVRRLRSWESPLRGDRFHFYDLLINRGLSARRVSCTCYAITAVLAAVGWAIIRCNAANRLLGAALSLGAVATALIRLGALRSDNGAWEHARRKPQRFSLSSLQVTDGRRTLRPRG
jgi:UDP-N-acetylmuramyl pentapeptide phosphotransferase/UDP-N-acetylglucosamine-1-phosphate transferase